MESDRTSEDTELNLPVASGSVRWGSFSFKCLEVLALLFVIPTAIVLVIDLNDRREQRIAQAWALVTEVAPGNSGKISALQFLNSEFTCRFCIDIPRIELFKNQVPLRGIDMSVGRHGGSVYLESIQLSGADLHGADLSGAYLDKANLYGADLDSAILNNTSLEGADLSYANLEDADLSNIVLDGANLTGAVLVGIDLTTASLCGVNFTSAYIGGASIPVINDSACEYDVDQAVSGFPRSDHPFFPEYWQE